MEKKKNTPGVKIPRSLINSAKALQFVSKDLTAVFLGKIFATPPRFKTPEREKMMEKSAKSEFFRIDSIEKDIKIYTYGFSKKKVLLAHGWSGRGTQLYNLADKILENRMMVISLDAPAHGSSSGKITNMLEYLETLKFIDEKYGPFHAAIGHSWGGMTLLLAVANGLRTEKLVTIGADDKISEVLISFVKKFELKPVIAKKIKIFYDKKLNRNIDELSSTKSAEKITIPTLVVHDSEDLFVPVSSAYRIRQKLKKGTILVTHGLGHHKIFKNPKVIQKIINFIQ
ncbi:MAG: alpha/beta hydrolase [Flavobacteriia bacterium]|nr:MAG: alpha/beta hydrolase [Flavobacteriia bacterium]